MYDTPNGPLSSFDARPVRRSLSIVGWACFAFMASAQAGSYGLALLLRRLSASGALSLPLWFARWQSWLLSYLPLYLLGLPVFLIVLSGAPAQPRAKRLRVRPRDFLGLLVICLGVMYLANLVTLGFVAGIERLSGRTFTNPLTEVTGSSDLLATLLFGAGVAPVMEELLFRGAVLRRLRPYGEDLAVFGSAFLFGMFHANYYQILYAFAVGCVLAYVALRTRGVLASILLHVAVNLSGTMASLLPAENTALATALGLAALALMGGCVALLVRRLPGVRLDPGRLPFSFGRRLGLFFGNSGVVCYCLLILTLATVTLFF